MREYYVYSTETVYYTTRVKARSRKDAINKIYDGKVEIGEPTDGENFEIFGAELIPELNPELNPELKQE